MTQVISVPPWLEKIKETDTVFSNGNGIMTSHARAKVGSILSSKESEENSSTEVSDLQLPSFVMQNERGIFIHLESLVNREILLSFLNYIFGEKYYFSNMNYTGITKILYDFEKTKTDFCQNMKKLGKVPEIKIASAFKKFDEKRISLYRKPIIAKGGKSAEYFFGPAYVEEIGENGKIKEVQTKIDIDEFIAAMWDQDIRFGLEIKDIQQAIHEDKQVRITIAREKDPTVGKDAVLEPAISFDIKLGIKESSGSKADMLMYEQSYLHIEKDAPLYKKIPREYGNLGWTIHGKQIDSEVPKDFSIDSYIGIGVQKETRGGTEYLVSVYSGFPRIEEVEITKWKQKVKQMMKIHVDERKTFEKGINVRESGKINKDNDFQSGGDISLDISGKNIFADQNIEANVYASENISVKGSIIGNAHSNPFSGKYEKYGALPKGQIVSDAGNIMVKGRVYSAYLEAKKGKVTIVNIENSVLIADSVEINGDATNCIIIANTIINKKKMVGCTVISGKKIDVAESTEKGNFENIFGIFSRDLTKDIQQKKEALEKEMTSVREMESRIDALVIASFQNMTKYDEGKRLSLIRVLIDILRDSKKIHEEKNKPYIELYKKIEPILIRSGTNWKKLENHTILVAKLSKEIWEETAIMESTQQELSIEIKNIQGTTHMKRVKFLQNRELLSLTIKEMDHIISRLMITGSSCSVCTLENIPAPTTGLFHWKPV
ncbi:MAG: hypothetical protein ACD_78C00464G0009 [uncultured bacterium (gcode 4)]|uniref:Flagellar Assembly Protein A N-terminal region domain-containing protein n=1 Tax=uncultured bacterium (gcode 4) TaxID=1234023 RepID=K1XVK8_9BACT|nr:MAG: hypothetical protein ACD_78C00464G0009 [uncultured bacterium (gcode 4)]